MNWHIASAIISRDDLVLGGQRVVLVCQDRADHGQLGGLVEIVVLLARHGLRVRRCGHLGNVGVRQPGHRKSGIGMLGKFGSPGSSG